MTFLRILLLVVDPQAAVLGAGAGPGDEPAEGQGCLRRVAEPFGDHSCPQGQYRGAVDADWEEWGGHGLGAYRLAWGSGTWSGNRRGQIVRSETGARLRQ
jgi:hypothetical protein